VAAPERRWLALRFATAEISTDITAGTTHQHGFGSVRVTVTVGATS